MASLPASARETVIWKSLFHPSGLAMGCGASTANAPTGADASPTGAAPSEEEKRYGPTIKGHEAAIQNLFKAIDADKNGYLVAGELKDLVSKYTGEAFDEKQFFEWFDMHGAGGTPDSQLDLKEFSWYLADICEGFDKPTESMSAVIQKFEEILSGPEATRYGPVIEGQEAAIEALFKKIDADGNGFLVAGELKDVVSKYTGEAFDEAQFFAWFDVHGASGEPDCQLDLKEFSWYLADIAEGFGDKAKSILPTIIKDMGEKCS